VASRRLDAQLTSIPCWPYPYGALELGLAGQERRPQGDGRQLKPRANRFPARIEIDELDRRLGNLDLGKVTEFYRA